MDHGWRQKYAQIIFITSLYPVFPVNFRFTKIDAAMNLIGRKKFPASRFCKEQVQMDCPDAKWVKRNLAPKIKMGTRVNCKLRTVSVPDDIISNFKFLIVAKVNSDRHVKTLGTLCGQLCNNKFCVTHLMIPRQMGKSDSCTMDGFEDVTEIHEKEDLILILLGWIHTYTGDSVFLSSVDMHNQHERQRMLPEVSHFAA